MKKLVFAAMAMVILASCGSKQQDPLANAISTKMAEYVAAQGDGSFKAEDVKINLYGDIEEVDKSTLGDELGRRRKVFETQEKVNLKKMEEYRRKGMENNAAAKEAAAAKSRVYQAKVDSLIAAYSDKLDSVIFRDYKFSAKAIAPTMNVDATDYYVSVTPDYQILAMTPDQKTLHKSTGRAVPGYSALFADEESE